MTMTSVSKDSKSLANDFSVLLAEMGVEAGTPVEKKVNAVFRILDELVPKLGVYAQIMGMVKHELYESVYSDQLTTSPDSGEPQRVPYFSLVSRIVDKTDARVDQLTEQVADLRERLYAKHTAYEESLCTMVELKNDIHELETEISELKQTIVDRDDTIADLEDKAKYELERTESVRTDLENRIKDLKDDLNDANDEIKFLYKYKDAYDDLQDAFEEKASDMVTDKKKRKHPVIATKRAHLISDIEQAYRLEEQLLAIENIAIEDFDQTVEEQKSIMVDGDNKTADPLTEDELRLKHTQFRKSIDDLNTELDLLQTHRCMLEEQLQILEENKPANKLREKRKKQKKMKESPMLDGLEPEPEDDLNEDPFTVQERVFSKYSAMIFTSADQGKTYHEIGTAAFCPACGEKTVVCPHKVGSKDRIFTVPRATTHIKVTRPKVKINQAAMEALFKPFRSPAGSRVGSGVEKRISSRERLQGADSQSPLLSESQNELDFGDTSSCQTPVQRDASTPASSVVEAAMDHYEPVPGRESKYPLSLMWDDYRSRTDLMRQVPRPLTLERTLSLMEQFLAYTLYQDEQIELVDDNYHCFMENLYYFLIGRYGKEDVGFLVAHDMFSALTDYISQDKLVQVFAHSLVGNFDGSVLRYLLIVAEFINCVEWTRVEDFRTFASVIYPFCTEDDLETLTMGYVSFSKNKISSSLVMDYVLYITLKGREPRFQEFEVKLDAIPCHEYKMMNCHEYTQALDVLLSLPDDTISKRLYKEAEGTVILIEGREDSVPLNKVAHIASYLSVLEVLPVMKDEIVNKMREARDRPVSREDEKSKSTLSSQSQVAPPSGTLMTYSYVKNLSTHLSSFMYVPASAAPSEPQPLLHMISEQDEEAESSAGSPENGAGNGAGSPENGAREEMETDQVPEREQSRATDDTDILLADDEAEN